MTGNSGIENGGGKKVFRIIDHGTSAEGISKGAIEQLEGESMLQKHDKMLMLAVAAGEKPATIVSPIYPEGDLAKQVVAQRIEQIAASLGLVFMKTGADSGNEYVFGRSPEGLSRIANLCSRPLTEPEDHYALGIALGFPETAARAFADRYSGKDPDALLNEAEIWKNFGTELGEFLFFGPSRTGWESEKEYLERVVRLIERTAPDLYKKIRYEA
jgi:hypothetical protein